MNTLLRYCTLLVLACFAVGHASAQSPWAQSYSHEAAGDYDAAIDALQPILATAPDHEFAVMRSAWLSYLNGDYNDSLRGYQRAHDINEQSLEALLGMTLPLLAQRRWREAAATAEQVLDIAPNHYYAHLRLMVAEEGLQQWRALADHATELATLYPSDATILVYLARARAWQGNVAAARAAYERVLERVPDHAEAAAYIQTNR